MKQILNYMPLDIISHPEGFIVVIPDGKDSRGKLKISFKFYNFTTGKVQPVKRSFYAQYKFGDSYEQIAGQIKDYISCAVSKDSQNFTDVVFPTGEIGIFDYMGTLIWTGDLTYHDSPVRGCATDEKCIWCAVPDQNAIVRYSTKLQRVDFRIGGIDTGALGRPMSLTKIGNYLYVCCKTSTNIKKVNLDNFVVEDYKTFEEGVLRYLNINGKEIVVLSSGIYLLD